MSMVDIAYVMRNVRPSIEPPTPTHKKRKLNNRKAHETKQDILSS